MLLLNVLTLLYMYAGYEERKERPPDDKTLAFSLDKESVLWQPLVCVHRCATELPYHKYPKDGLCDLFYLQLHADRPVAQTRSAPCYKEFSKLAKFARITRHGLLIHRSQSNASYWQLKTEEGMFEFVTLWANEIRSYGLGDLFLNTSASTDELGLHLPLIIRLREMQSLLDDMTGKYVERRYMLLDVRTSYTYPAADLVTLSKLLHAAMEFPIDLLLLRTHLSGEGPKPCMVLGPTTSVRTAAMDAVDVPIMSESAVMASHAKPPDYVTVLLSFSARTLYFNVPQTWSLGMPCDNMAEAQFFSEVCHDLPKPVTKDGIEKAWFMKSSSRRKPPQVITFDDNSTIWPKMKLVYKLYTGKRLGWAIDDVEYDVDGTECHKATPLVQVVAQGRPDRFPHLP